MVVIPVLCWSRSREEGEAEQPKRGRESQEKRAPSPKRTPSLLHFVESSQVEQTQSSYISLCLYIHLFYT